MHIAVNTRLLVGDRLDGIGIFVRETMVRIVRAHPEHQFTFIFNAPWQEEFLFAENVTPVLLGPVLREPISQLWWQEVRLPRLLRKIRADLYLSPEPTHSLRTGWIPRVEVLHDLNFEHHPDLLPFYWSRYYRTMAHRYAKAADRIATVSAYSKEDIVNTYGVAPEKIDIVYNGAPEPKPLPSTEEIREIQRTWSEGLPYFYFVGTIQQRKNIAGMLRAFELFRERSDERVLLLIAGRKKWWTDEMERVWSSMNYADDVRFIGRVKDDELHRVASASLGLLYVPFFEGFGIPILEAYRAGVPVITARTTSMPEVAGEAALLADPHNPEEIAEAMLRMAGDIELRHDLAAKGEVRAQHFTWEKTAELLWESVEKAMLARRK